MFKLLTKEKAFIYYSDSTDYSEPVTKDKQLEMEPPLIVTRDNEKQKDMTEGGKPV